MTSELLPLATTTYSKSLPYNDTIHLMYWVS